MEKSNKEILSEINSILEEIARLTKLLENKYEALAQLNESEDKDPIVTDVEEDVEEEEAVDLGAISIGFAAALDEDEDLPEDVTDEVEVPEDVENETAEHEEITVIEDIEDENEEYTEIEAEEVDEAVEIAIPEIVIAEETSEDEETEVTEIEETEVAETEITEVEEQEEVPNKTEELEKPRAIIDMEPQKKTVLDTMEEQQAWRKDRPGTPVNDVRSAISLNDRLLFIKSLFGRDPEAFVAAIDKINSMSDFEQAVEYITTTYPKWNMNSDTVYRFMMAVRRKLK